MPSPNSKNTYDYRYRGWESPTLGFVLRINERILGHGNGLKSENLLLSALNAPIESAGGEDAYYHKFDKVAAIAFRLVSNHPFHDANKRTALLVTEAILEWNNFRLNWSDDTKTILFSLLGASYLGLEGLRHALLLGCALDPIENVP